MKPFTLLVKPTSADCNLRCGYCFYLDRSELYPETQRHRMSDDVLEWMISTYMQTDQQQYAFGWQGGEPTLMGVDFFRRVVRYQQAHGKAGAAVSNGLQTNTTLIDDEFAQHLAEYHFLVGVSVDGPPEIHDRYRVRADGRGSHGSVLKGLDALRRNRVEHNILTLVSRSNVDRPADVYRYLCDMGILFHQYIECVEFNESGGLMPFAINGSEWGSFLCGIFDEWVKADTHRVSIRLFDTILMKMVDGVANTCSAGTDCRQYLVVEHNGDIYPCDFFVRPELRLGNIMDNGWDEMLASPLYAEFGARKRKWCVDCAGCDYLEFCAGDCPKNRSYAGRDPSALSPLCEGWKQFYRHTLPAFREFADDVRAERRAQSAASNRAVPPVKSVGRNDPCPCGSGRKFKKCCGRAKV